MSPTVFAVGSLTVVSALMVLVLRAAAGKDDNDRRDR